MSRWPLSAWLLGIPGFICLLFGTALMLGLGRSLHPLLANTGAGLAVLVSGVALVGSAAFPIAFARLAARDEDGSSHQ